MQKNQHFGLNVKPGRKPVLPKAVEDKIVDTVKLAASSKKKVEWVYQGRVC